MKTEAQSLLWRVYAVVFVLSVGIPQAVGVVSHGSVLKALGSLVIFCACAGIATWAFGFRLGTNLFWKAIGALLMVVLAYGLYPSFTDLVSGKANHWSGSWIAALATIIVLFAIAPLALCRAGTRPERSAADLIVENKPILGKNKRLDHLKTRATS